MVSGGRSLQIIYLYSFTSKSSSESWITPGKKNNSLLKKSILFTGKLDVLSRFVDLYLQQWVTTIWLYDFLVLRSPAHTWMTQQNVL